MHAEALSLDFGSVYAGSSADVQSVTIHNTRAAILEGFAGGGVGAPFSATQNCAPELDPSETCELFYGFSPTEAGVFTATSTVSNSAGSVSIELRGEGVGADLSMTPLVLDFGPVPVGTSGTSQVVTVRNTGLAVLDGFAGGGVAAPFSASQSCSSGVAPGDTCQIFYNFHPTEEGLFTATSNVGTNAGGFTIELIGGVDPTIFDDGFESGDTDAWSSAMTAPR